MSALQDEIRLGYFYEISHKSKAPYDNRTEHKIHN